MAKQLLFQVVLASPPWGRRERGFPVLHYNLAMPVKNPSTTLRAGIIPGQTFTKEKLQRDPSVLRTSPHFQKTKMGRCRHDMTPAEKILWQELRGNKLGVHFRRQQVIAGFIFDLYCHKAGLVIEVDGDIHDLQQEEDARREKVLREMGLRIVRFRNEEVMRELSAVVGKISELVA